MSRKSPSDKYLFTSESVSRGHPDKMADQISDAVLDAILEQDPTARVACETLLTTGLVTVAGEITTKPGVFVDYWNLVRETVREIGYTSSDAGFDADTCAVLVALGKQSPDIAQGVDENAESNKDIGAGDQGLMFGFACDETEELMPMPIAMAHRIIHQITELRVDGTLAWLRPDSKSQVTIEYDGYTPKRIQTVVVSTQHAPDVTHETIRKEIIEKVVKPVLPAEMLDDQTVYHINPTGKFVVGGPKGDAGVTGRKIIVDTYGGMGRHGGGAFSGKDPTKVDRSAAYMARYIAKNVVAAKLARRCEIQLAYAIGVSEPVSVHVDTFGTVAEGVTDRRISELIREHFALTPSKIIKQLDLRRPIFRHTAWGGHFGVAASNSQKLEVFTWERTDKATELAQAAGTLAMA